MMPFLKSYAVYIRPGDEHPLESAVLVREGFSIWVYVFSLLWAIYYRVWRLALVIFLFYAFANFLFDNEVIDMRDRLILEMGFLIWLSFEASDWRGRSLERRGFVLLEVILARSEDEARQRLFDRYLSTHPVEGALPA